MPGRDRGTESGPEHSRTSRGNAVPALALFTALVSVSLAAAAFAEVPVPKTPPAHVVDLADLIPDDLQSRIESALVDLERKSTAQVVVLTVPLLQGESIERYSLRVAELWRLGQKGKDNGLLLTIALQERQYRFEVGYGLESILPDSLVGSIGRECLVPAFQSGNHGSGILLAVEAIAARIALPGTPGAESGTASPANAPPGKSFSILVTVGVVAALLGAIFFNARSSWRRRREAEKLEPQPKRVFRGPAHGASSSDGASGTDSGGDSFSGGGGRFGGGGASGRW